MQNFTKKEYKTAQFILFLLILKPLYTKLKLTLTFILKNEAIVQRDGLFLSSYLSTLNVSPTNPVLSIHHSIIVVGYVRRLWLHSEHKKQLYLNGALNSKFWASIKAKIRGHLNLTKIS